VRRSNSLTISGYPVLVRPSYVLGGRAMRVVEDDAELEEYIEEAVRVSPDKPILVDQFLDDAVELDVDAVADGDDVLLGGVMEHVESAGVHSGDSACMIPPRSLGEETLARVREVTEDIARALDTVGPAQRPARGNGRRRRRRRKRVRTCWRRTRAPRGRSRSSRSRRASPSRKLAAKVMTDDLTLADLDVDEQIPEHRSVKKEVVLPFDRLPGSDPRLGPEMKSTGEVMGTARSFGKAYDKAQDSTNKPIPESGTAVVDLSADEFPDPDTEAGESLVAGVRRALRAERGDGPDRGREARRDRPHRLPAARELLEVAVEEEEITYFSTHASAKAALEAIDHKGDDLDVMAVSDRPKRRELGRRRVDGGSTSGLSTSDTVYKRPRIAAIVYKRYATCARLFIRLLAFRGPRPRRPSARRRTPLDERLHVFFAADEINSGPIAPTTSLRATTVRSIIRENASPRARREENIVSDPS